MSQSLAKVSLRAVFSTKDRFPFLQRADIREEMHAYLGGIRGIEVVRSGETLGRVER